MPRLTLASVASERASMKRSSSSRVRMDSMVMLRFEDIAGLCFCT